MVQGNLPSQTQYQHQIQKQLQPSQQQQMEQHQQQQPQHQQIQRNHSLHYGQDINSNSIDSRSISDPTTAQSYQFMSDSPLGIPSKLPIDNYSNPSSFNIRNFVMPTDPMSVRQSGYQPLLPHRDSLIAPKAEPRLRFDLDISGFPRKTRKRHKVATSCNRCRQNKRKCDSGIPCSNCKKNKSDCLYTDAQQSRSTWGDSPLSREKIIGVSASSNENDPKSQVDTTTASKDSTTKDSTKPPKGTSVLRKQSIPKSSIAIDRNQFSHSTSLSSSLSSSNLQFNPGHASIDESMNLNRRREALQEQSKQIAKAIRVAKIGPQLDLSKLLSNEPSNSAGSSHKQPIQHASGVLPAKPEPATFSIPETSNMTNSAIHLPKQPIHNGGWQQDHRRAQFSPPPPPPSQNGLRIQQVSMNLHVDPISSSSQPLTSSSNTMKQHLSFAAAENVNQSYLKYPQQSYSLNKPNIPECSDGEVNTTGSQSFTLTQSSFGDMRHESSKDQPSNIAFSDYHIAAPSRNSTEPQRGPNASIPLQTHHSSISSQYEISHAISSAAPVSSIAVSSHHVGINSWDHVASTFPINNKQGNEMKWTGEKRSQQSGGPSAGHISSVSQDLINGECHTSISQKIQSEEQSEIQRMQKIAKEILECRKYDYSFLLPRHISQEYDEMWIAPDSTSASDLQKIPRQLLVLPKDANFLVDVFFENACFYYPILNRSIVELHLMEPETPQSLFLLNIIFMAACKHLARNTDIKRAIQFRERAREIQQYIDGKARLSRMQGNLLGAQVIYGVFVVVIGMAQLCGTYRPMPADETDEDNVQRVDLAAESRSILANKYLMPESVYQQRLWTFWGLYTRDAMSRLYFGWPHGFDSMDISAELPKIKGVVGLGGTRRNSTGQNGINGQQVTGKRRGGAMNKQQQRREKKLMKAGAAAQVSSRDAYRISTSISDDDDDDDDDDFHGDDDDESDLEQGDFDASNIVRMDVKVENDIVERNQRSKRPSLPGTKPGVDNKSFSFSGLSRHLLEKQSRGEELGRRQGSSMHATEIRRHFDRMKVLLDAESDVTDGGTYARVLFLEEIKLWSIGRRVGLYLQSRSTSHSVSPAASTTISYPTFEGRSSISDSGDPFSSIISTSLEASRCSERAWIEDKELQSLQADLIAWEQALSSTFKFRQDVEGADINHKVNGRLGILTMYYYTITIMLQSSYLPIPQYLSSSSRSTGFKSPESISQEYEGLFSRATSMAASEEGGPRVKSEAEEYFHSGRSPQPSSNGYFNTAHQICTQLSNVLYHHIELLLDSYPNWCTIQCKLNQSLTAALRVSCLNARLSSNSRAIRDEAKAGFKMGSELFKRQAILPAPLTIRDWPAEEDVQVMENLEEEFRELMTAQDDEEQAEAEARSRSQTQDSEGINENGDPGDHLLYTPDFQDVSGDSVLSSLDTISPQYEMLQAEHVFGIGEGFQFDYNIDA